MYWYIYLFIYFSKVLKIKEILRYIIGKKLIKKIWILYFYYVYCVVYIVKE